MERIYVRWGCARLDVNARGRLREDVREVEEVQVSMLDRRNYLNINRLERPGMSVHFGERWTGVQRMQNACPLCTSRRVVGLRAVRVQHVASAQEGSRRGCTLGRKADAFGHGKEP